MEIDNQIGVKLLPTDTHTKRESLADSTESDVVFDDDAIENDPEFRTSNGLNIIAEEPISCSTYKLKIGLIAFDFVLLKKASIIHYDFVEY